MEPDDDAIPDPNVVGVGCFIQSHRVFTLSEATEELPGHLDVPNEPEISAGYADIYHGIWTTPQGERLEVAVKELKTLIPKDRQTDREALKKRTDTVAKFFLGAHADPPVLLTLVGPAANKTGGLRLESDKTQKPPSSARLPFGTQTAAHQSLAPPREFERLPKKQPGSVPFG